MAEEKKEETSGGGFDWLDGAFYLLLIFAGITVFNYLLDFIGGVPGREDVAGFSVYEAAPLWVLVSAVVSFPLLVIVFTLIRKIDILTGAVKQGVEPPDSVSSTTPIERLIREEDRVNERWEEVLSHLESDRESDWRMAILEADIMLGEMLDALGYEGEDIGTQLKQANHSEFRTLDQAWEAHKIRNRVAHEGSRFSLTRSQTAKVLDLFRDVFEEFKFI